MDMDNEKIVTMQDLLGQTSKSLLRKNDNETARKHIGTMIYELNDWYDDLLRRFYSGLLNE